MNEISGGGRLSKKRRRLARGRVCRSSLRLLIGGGSAESDLPHRSFARTFFFGNFGNKVHTVTLSELSHTNSK